MSTRRRGYVSLNGREPSSIVARAGLGLAIVALITAVVLGGIALANSVNHEHHPDTQEEFTTVSVNGIEHDTADCRLPRALRATGYTLTNKSFFEDRSANFETCTAVNPKNPKNILMTLHVAFLQRDVPIFHSLDGGHTWTRSDVALSRCQSSVEVGAINDISRVGDPWVTFDKDGNAYGAFLAFDDDYSGDPVFEQTPLNIGILIVKSTDEGRTWDFPRRILWVTRDDPAWPDKPGIFGTNIPDTVIVSWAADYVTQIYVQRSIDGADTFEPKIALDYSTVPSVYSPDVCGNLYGSPCPAPVLIWGGNIVTLPDGTLIHGSRHSALNTDEDIGFGPGANEQVYIHRSTDNGETWGPMITAIPDLTQTFFYDAPTDFLVRDVAIWHDLKVNPKNGWLYIIATDQRAYVPVVPCDGYECFGSDVVITMSKDGGFTWTPPKLVNPHIGNFQSSMSTLSVFENGNVGVVYMTDRNHNYATDDGTAFFKTDYYITILDKDLNCVGEKRLTPTSFNLRNSPPNNIFGIGDGYEVGDYITSASIGNDIVFTIPVYTFNDGRATACTAEGCTPMTQPSFPLRDSDATEFTKLKDRSAAQFVRTSTTTNIVPIDCPAVITRRSTTHRKKHPPISPEERAAGVKMRKTHRSIE